MSYEASEAVQAVEQGLDKAFRAIGHVSYKEAAEPQPETSAAPPHSRSNFYNRRRPDGGAARPVSLDSSEG
ncbi:hypothetical protein [Streptomyces sp. NPDC059909]|uniref:hypothetical protein n=1 Tax=Streptomyces sp. NPDC059909 TaxID=3346998 RepID=UPI0036641CD2